MQPQSDFLLIMVKVNGHLSPHGHAVAVWLKLIL